MLNEIQPLSKRRFHRTARTTTTVTAAATPPTIPPTICDIELGLVSGDAVMKMAFNGCTFALLDQNPILTPL